MILAACGIFTPLALVLAVPADVAVTLLQVCVQVSLLQTGEVAVYAANRRATCEVKPAYFAIPSQATLNTSYHDFQHALNDKCDKTEIFV